MHIPNGLLDPKVSAGASFAAAGVLGFCIAKVRQALSALVPESALAGAGNIGCNMTENSKKLISTFAESHIMKMGAIASLIFAGQMFNFPINNGTSGHLLGGVIASIALGPFSGALVIASVLAVQSIFFADGGLIALGANIINMAVVGALASYYIYYVINKLIRSDAGFFAGAGIAAFLSVLLASAACSFEISLSGTIELSRILPAMLSVHAVIGLAEALITIMALNLLRSAGFKLEGEIKHEK
jgi:cobalt/nickel transport system permease protein